MKTTELQREIDSMIEKKEFASLRNFLYSTFDIFYKTENGYTTNRSAASYNSQGSCVNSYLKCEDGYVVDPF
jgi:hypothetical protein